MKKAMQRLVRHADGRMRVQYIDLETLQPITDLTGYEIVNQASNYVEEESDAPEEETQPPVNYQPTSNVGGGGGYPYLSEIHAFNRDKKFDLDQFPEAPQAPAQPLGDTTQQALAPRPQPVQPVQNQVPDVQPPVPTVLQAPRVQGPAPSRPKGTAPNPEAKGFARLVSPPTPSDQETGITFAREDQSNIDPAFRDSLEGASKDLGRNLPISSGYRSPEYNERKRQEALAAGRTGPAKNSLHMQGQAADIDMSGMSDEERAQLVSELRQRGVTRFGTYTDMPDVLHVDTHAQPQAQGGAWFMHDKTNRNMASAPGWLQGLQATDGINFPAQAPIPSPSPRGLMAETAAQEVIKEAKKSPEEEKSKSTYQGFAPETSQGKMPDNPTMAQATALGYGFNDLDDNELSQVALVVAGELSPSARASIASGQPNEEAIAAMGGILGTMANRTASRNMSLKDVAFEDRDPARPNNSQYSAVNEGTLPATKAMYTPVAQSMDEAVSGYLSGDWARIYGLDILAPNPTATNYHADYVSPAWSPQMQDVSRDSTGHIFGYLPEYGAVNAPPSSISRYQTDQRGYQAARSFSDPSSGFAGPSNFGPSYVDSPAHGMTGARGGFAGGGGTNDFPSRPSSHSGGSVSYSGGGPGWGSSGDYISSSPSKSSSSKSSRGGFTSTRDTYGGTPSGGSGVAPSGFGGALSGI